MNQNSFCKRKPDTGKRLLEVSLLILLSGNQSHGYDLMDKISRLDFFQQDINGSTLYRTLRKMESNKLVHSQWGAGIQGPKRRIYDITNLGKKELDSWILILKSRKASIEKLIDNYEELMNEN